MDAHAQTRALEIIDEFIGKHTPQEAWDDREHEWLVYCEECGEILDYNVRLKDLEDDPWHCQDTDRLIELRGLVE